MSEHDEFQAGVPCWVDTLQPDPTSAVGFYAELFGWEVENRTASDLPRKYFVCKLRGRAVAGVGSRPSEGVPSDWNTYVRVDSVEEAAAKAVESGGSVVLEPFDWLDGGVRRGRTRAHDVAPARVRRGGAGAAGATRHGRRDGVDYQRGLPRRRPSRAATPLGAGRGGCGASLERQLLGPRRGRGWPPMPPSSAGG
jgi:predicted enzyme related to lactoylglutathione lyase